MKQETLEEAAERLSELQEGTYTPQHKITYKHGFTDCAKWQQERSYSEEEVQFIERLIGFYWVENNSEHQNNLEEWELSKKLIEQFKKN